MCGVQCAVCNVCFGLNTSMCGVRCAVCGRPSFSSAGYPEGEHNLTIRVLGYEENYMFPGAILPNKHTKPPFSLEDYRGQAGQCEHSYQRASAPRGR